MIDITNIVNEHTWPYQGHDGKWYIHCKICHTDICEDKSWGPRTGVRSYRRHLKYVAPLQEAHIRSHFLA